MKHLNQRRRFGTPRFVPIHCNDDGGGGGGGGDGDGGGGDGGAGGDSGGDGGGDGDGGGVIDFFGTVPDDWRTQALVKAGFEAESEDFSKGMKQLERVSDFGVFTKNYLSAQDKIRTGMISTGLPENATEDQISEYREANGVPATAEDYNVQLDDGLVLGEADNRIMGPIFELAHAANISGDTMSAMTNAMLTGRAVEADARLSQDGIDTQQTTSQLKEAWGGDFEVNNNAVKRLVNKLPESVKENFMNARFPDGRAIFNSPEVMVAMAEWERAIDPAGTVVPNSANSVQAMTDEIAALEARMGDDDWHKDIEANKRLEDLYTAQERMEAQA